jgi:hypothetical protein
MNCTIRRFVIAVACAVLAVSAAVPDIARVEARGGVVPAYCDFNDHVFWFIHLSDTHVGMSGSSDTSRLTWIVNTGRSVIKPLFTVVTGDLTDSTNGNFFGIPNGPYLSEWQAYRGILDAAKLTTDEYYDIPGNHDAYSDATFYYFRTWGLQGPAYASAGQVSWTKTSAWGEKYHFLAVNTADNTGAAFSLSSPYGDHAGLDPGEISGLRADLAAAAPTASLSFVFGHHPVTGTGNSSDTYLYYGYNEFVAALDDDAVLAYNYGHVHDNVEAIFRGDGYAGLMSGPGVRYRRVASLGKSSGDTYSLVSVDCNGVNTVTQPVSTWPLVIITAPVHRYVGGALNPYAYDVPAGTSTRIRALVFDSGTVGSVQFRVDGGTTWYPMTRVTGTPRWTGSWDSSTTAAGEHTIEVRAVGTTTRSHSVAVNLAPSGVNRPPSAVGDNYTVAHDTTLSVTKPGVLGNDSDPDGNALTAQPASPAAHGSVALAPDGSFSYTPTAGYSGPDSFTYRAYDGTATSAETAVTIAVTPPVTESLAIVSAKYSTRSKVLSVTATDTLGSSVTLTLLNYGVMTYNATTTQFTYSKKVSANPGTVVVRSSTLLETPTFQVTTTK